MKKVLALVMAAMMVMAMFAGCQPADTGSTNGDGSTSAVVKIGMMGPLTGGAAVYGTAVKAAMEIAVAEINAKGGIQFELKYEDDAHDAELQHSERLGHADPGRFCYYWSCSGCCSYGK